MAPTPSTRRPLRARPAVPHSGARTALAALVVALVVGILGMHALASHGTPEAPAATSSMTGMTSAHEAAMATGGAHDGHAHTTGHHTPGMATAESGPDPGSGSGSGHGMGSMVMLCVVMLAAAALTLLVLLAVGFVRRVLPTTLQPAAVRAQALQWVRGTGPPYVWQFSVIRC